MHTAQTKYSDIVIALAKDKSVEAENCFRKSNDFDYMGFIKFLETNQLAGFVYYALNKLNIAHILPPAVKAHLKFRYLNQWKRAERQLQEMILLKQLCGKEGIDLIFFKGIITLKEYFGDMSVRRLSDIDLLAKKKDIDSIGRLLADNGYKRISNIFLDNKKFTIEKALSHFQYKKDSMVVEAHWKFQNIPGVAFNEERVWQKARDIDIGNMHFRTLCVEDALLAHILSFFVDLELKRALYLKALLHIYGILSKCYDKIDWLQFFEERKTDGTYKISLNILFICIDIFQAKDEFPILWNLFKERNEHIAKDLNLDFNITRSIGDYIKNKIASFYMLDVPFSKALFWWGETLPYRILGYR